MLSTEENELITSVGEGTLTGELFRRYWMPLLLTEELTEAQDAPVRVRALGEDFVAYRDNTGTARIIGALCPHRRTNLVYAANEGCGLRCLYHGWLIDGSGTILEMPNDSVGNARHKIKHRACPTAEAGGIVWGYLGPEEDRPPPPPMEWANLPEGHVAASKVMIHCNYLQCLEGGLDPSHAGSLHRSALSNDESPNHPRQVTRMLELLDADPAPFLEVDMSSTGIQIAADRTIDEATRYMRISTWVAPWFASVPDHEGVPRMINGFTPIDDTTTWVWFIWRDPENKLNVPVLKKTSGIHEMSSTYETNLNYQNQHLQDRQAMREGRSFTGIQGISNEDTAMQEAQGPIADRPSEHLISADQAIIRARQGILKRARDLQAGILPEGRSEDIPFRVSQSICWTYSPDKDWRDDHKKYIQADE